MPATVLETIKGICTMTIESEIAALRERAKKFPYFTAWSGPDSHVWQLLDDALAFCTRLAALHKPGEVVAVIEDWPNDWVPLGIVPLVDLKDFAVGTKLCALNDTVEKEPKS